MNISSDEDALDEMKKGSRKKRYSSDENSSFYTSESESDRDDKKRRRKGKKKKDRSRENKIKGEAADIAANSTSKKDIARKEMGLDWMLRSESTRPAVSKTNEILPEEAPVEEVRLSIKFCFPSAVYLSNSHV